MKYHPISIIVNSRARKQQIILQSIPTQFIRIQGNIFKVVGIYNKRRRVQDVFRYTITVNDGDMVLHNVGGSIGCFGDLRPTKSVNKRIILITESPHKDEYTNQFIPIAPAQGATGRNIGKYIIDILTRHCNGIQSGEYDLIISNPVQFQASLYKYHNINLYKNTAAKSIRDKAWLFIYKTEEVNFIKRIRVYNPEVVILACTEKLRIHVFETIRTNFPSTIIVFLNKHPSSWMFGSIDIVPYDI